MALLELKDILGPAISISVALLTAFYARKNYRMTKRLAERTLYHEGQKILIEIDKQLIADPKLWAIYDQHFVTKDPEFKPDSPVFQAKLEAFACLKINMFELVLPSAPDPEEGPDRNPTNVWLDYFHHSVANSAVIRRILDRPESATIWSPVIIQLYEMWKSRLPAKHAVSV